ncbi:MAG: DUF3347 domain-containing protein [Paludibacter sp.]|jgi:hypothetical protein
MKKIILGLALAAITLAACNNKSTESKANKAVMYTNSDEKNLSPINELVNQYLQIKNGLANDNGTDAATAGKAFVESIAKVNTASFTTDQKKKWDDISADAKEMAEHIGANADKLEHQREHFEMLSQDIYDLVKTFGAGQVLYKDADTMYNKGKGAFWLSEIKEIKNPYMGKAMFDSGSIKEEIK